MLRPVKNSQLLPELVFGIITNDADDNAGVSQGAQDLSATYEDAGETVVSFKNQFQRGAVVVASIKGETAGGYPALNKATQATDKSGFAIETLDEAGAGEEGEATCFAVGWNSQFTDAFRKDTAIVASSSPRTRMLGFRVASGAIDRGKRDGTIATNGTGDYTITFRKAFGNTVPYAVAVVENSSGGSVQVSAVTAGTVRVKTFNTSNAAAAINFHLVVVGIDTKTRSKGKRALNSSQIKPRLIACHVVNTAGDPAITIGGVDGSLVDNGTGDYTLTFAKPFARRPIVVGLGDTSRFTLKADPLTTAVTVVTRAANHSAADKDCSILVLGFDSVDEV